MKRFACMILAAAVCFAPAAAAESPAIETLTPSAGAMTLAWDNTGAEATVIYRASSRWGSYRKIGMTSAATYKDCGLQTGAAYWYKIRACRADGTEQGGFSSPVGAISLPIVQLPAVQNPCWRQGRTIEVQGLMLHSVGCAQEQAAAFAQSMNRSDAEVLVHAVIEPSGKVYQLADWNTRTWHCGGSGNDSLIGVEMTEPQELRYLEGACFAWTGDARETALKNYETAVRLFASLCLRYDLDPMEDICSHSEAAREGKASSHADPEHLWFGLGLPMTMDTFRQDVQNTLQGRYAGRSVEEAGNVVTVTAEKLNIRAGAGTGYAVKGTLYRGERIAVREIVQSGQHHWGKLANGGWIALTYTAD